jgi:hypothetical protein
MHNRTSGATRLESSVIGEFFLPLLIFRLGLNDVGLKASVAAKVVKIGTAAGNQLGQFPQLLGRGELPELCG